MSYIGMRSDTWVYRRVLSWRGGRQDGECLNPVSWWKISFSVFAIGLPEHVVKLLAKRKAPAKTEALRLSSYS
jgi:hypothetical protein